MSRVAEAIARARAQGFRVSMADGQVRLAPRSKASIEQFAWLYERRAEVAAFLAAESTPPEPNAQGPPAQSNGHHAANGHVPFGAIATHRQGEVEKAEDGFTMLPNWVFGVPAQHQLGASSTVVFFHVLRWTLGFRRVACTRSVGELAEESGLGRATVIRALAELQAKGLISRVDRTVPTGQRTRSLITLVFGTAAELGVSK